MVSIIIPCFNAERYIGEAIQSALEQTYPNCEVIVIDDGSTDGSVPVIQSFGEKIIWETGPHQGACAARNRGIELSRGAWIQFLDADDKLKPDAVQLKREANVPPDTIVCLKGQLMESQAGSRRIPPHANFDRYNLETLLRGATPQTSAPLHRKEHLEQVGGFTVGLPCCQEYDLHLRLTATLGLGFHVLPKVGTYIRVVEDGITGREAHQFQETRANIWMRLLGSLMDNPRFDAKCKLALSQTMGMFARGLWRAGKRHRARELLQVAKTLHPDWAGKAYRLAPYRFLVRVIGFEAYERLHGIFAGAKHRLASPRSGLHPAQPSSPA